MLCDGCHVVVAGFELLQQGCQGRFARTLACSWNTAWDALPRNGFRDNVSHIRFKMGAHFSNLVAVHGKLAFHVLPQSLLQLLRLFGCRLGIIVVALFVKHNFLETRRSGCPSANRGSLQRCGFATITVVAVGTTRRYGLANAMVRRRGLVPVWCGRRIPTSSRV